MKKNMSKQIPEVLAPAGDYECLQAAVRFGADAVYLGATRFGMRASSATFTEDLLNRGVKLAHQNGVRIYLTCNTIPTNEEIDAFPDFLKEIGKAGVDALIVTDLGVLSLVKKYLPEMEVHISTQAGVVNYLTASELYKMGAKRVVLARELSLDDIARIRENTPPELEIETFVHGAMCVSFFRAMSPFQLSDRTRCKSRRMCSTVSMGIPFDGGKTAGNVFPD